MCLCFAKLAMRCPSVTMCVVIGGRTVPLLTSQQCVKIKIVLSVSYRHTLKKYLCFQEAFSHINRNTKLCNHYLNVLFLSEKIFVAVHLHKPHKIQLRVVSSANLAGQAYRPKHVGEGRINICKKQE